MTASAIPQPRVKTGQYTFADRHVNEKIKLTGQTVAEEGLKLTADFGDDLMPEHRTAIDHWHGRLQDAGVAGEIEILSVDGADSDAGGPTVAGNWKTPEGHEFTFAVDNRAIELTRGNVWHLDDSHKGETSTLLKGAASPVNDEDLTGTFQQAQERARTADAWASHSAVRSNSQYRFDLPSLISEAPGHESGEVMMSTPSGDDYAVRVDRGTSDVRVYGPGNGALSKRMADAFLTDVSEACGGNTSPDDIPTAIMRSLEAGTGENW